ncbi:hypothetical protein DFH09DRAFT_118189 [Mycena vulgaris]|nr:hypothetical protein DFH09DRAFT_118189 [Mycena vulgaris]
MAGGRAQLIRSERYVSLLSPAERDEYVRGQYNETKQRDTELLGGEDSMLRGAAGGGAGAARWKVDEEDAGSLALGSSCARYVIPLAFKEISRSGSPPRVGMRRV